MVTTNNNNSTLINSPNNAGINQIYLKSIPQSNLNLFLSCLNFLPKSWLITGSNAGGLRACAGKILGSNICQLTTTPKVQGIYFLFNKNYTGKITGNNPIILWGCRCFLFNNLASAKVFITANSNLFNGSKITPLNNVVNVAKKINAKVTV